MQASRSFVFYLPQHILLWVKFANCKDNYLFWINYPKNVVDAIVFGMAYVKSPNSVPVYSVCLR